MGSESDTFRAPDLATEGQGTLVASLDDRLGAQVGTRGGSFVKPKRRTAGFLVPREARDGSFRNTKAGRRVALANDGYIPERDDSPLVDTHRSAPPARRLRIVAPVPSPLRRPLTPEWSGTDLLAGQSGTMVARHGRRSKRGSKVSTKPSFITESEEREKRRNVSEFPMPPLDNKAAYKTPPNGVEELAHMRGALDEMTIEDEAPGSRTKAALLRAAWLSPPSRAMVIAFAWHALSTQFQQDDARESFLFAQLAALHGQLYTSSILSAKAKDQLSWHLPDAMSRAACRILHQAFPRSHASIDGKLRLLLCDRLVRWTSGFGKARGKEGEMSPRQKELSQRYGHGEVAAPARMHRRASHRLSEEEYIETAARKFLLTQHDRSPSPVRDGGSSPTDRRVNQASRLHHLLTHAVDLRRDDEVPVLPGINRGSLAGVALAACTRAQAEVVDRRRVTRSCKVGVEPRAQRSPRDLNAHSQLTAAWLQHLRDVKGARSTGGARRVSFPLLMTQRRTENADEPSASSPTSPPPQARSARTYRDVRQQAMGKSKRWRADFSSGFSETATELSAAAQTARVHRGEVDAGLRTVLGSGGHVRDLANYVTSLGRIQEDARRLERLTN